VAIQPRTATSADEITHILDLSKPRALLASTAEHIGQLQESVCAATLDGLVKICSVPAETTVRGWMSIASVLDCPSKWLDRDLDAVDDEPEDLALVLFTSGTTGKPKGCMHTQRSITSMLRNHAASLDLDEVSSSISHLTLSHCFGMLYSGSFWSKGAKVVYASPAFGAKATLRALELERCTHMPAVPSLLYSLLDTPRQSNLS